LKSGRARRGTHELLVLGPFLSQRILDSGDDLAEIGWVMLDTGGEIEAVLLQYFLETIS
jgi:hypothetical protein